MHQDLIAVSAARQSRALLARVGRSSAALGPTGRPAAPATAPVLDDLGMGALLHFRSLMALDGHPVQVARMCFDLHYAFDRIALAHTSAHDPLRRLALELFQNFHRRDEARRQAA